MLMGRLYIIQDGRCFHCGNYMSPRSRATDESKGWTREHVYPKVLNHEDRRVVLAHQRCNAERGTKPFTEEELYRVDKIYEELEK